MDVPAVRLIMLGGVLRRESNSLSWPMAAAALANLQADRLYLGADGLDPQLGVMTPHLQEAELGASHLHDAEPPAVLQPGQRRAQELSVAGRRLESPSVPNA